MCARPPTLPSTIPSASAIANIVIQRIRTWSGFLQIEDCTILLCSLVHPAIRSSSGCSAS